MTRKPFPTVAAYPLPASLSLLPAATPAKPATTETPHENGSDERNDLVQAVSDAIARRARQRRYTP